MRLLKTGVLALLVGVAALAAAGERKTVLLVGQSRDNHPPTTHEYMAGVERLAKLLEPTEDLKVRVVNADGAWSDGPALLDGADGAVLFLSEGARWLSADPRRHEAFTRLAARGGGLVALHWAIGTRTAEPIEPFVRLLGGCHGGPDRKYQVVDTPLRVVDPDHPITAGVPDFRVHDEFYYQLKFIAPPQSIRPVLEAMIDGRRETVAWSWQRPDGGRSFGFSGLHFDENWKTTQYPKLLKQAVLWTVKK